MLSNPQIAVESDFSNGKIVKFRDFKFILNGGHELISIDTFVQVIYFILIVKFNFTNKTERSYALSNSLAYKVRINQLILPLAKFIYFSSHSRSLFHSFMFFLDNNLS